MIDPVQSLAVSMHANPGVYALLLGSGISRPAGIRTGWEITVDLIEKMAASTGQSVEGSLEQWFHEKYGRAPNYSELLDGLARTQTERQRLLHSYFEANDQEREEGLKEPTAAHRAIADLVAQGYVKVIITTNFDRLTETALQDVGVVPTVLSSPELVEGAIPLIHMKCCVFKVHGDYPDPRIRNTHEELDQYPEGYDRLLDRVFDEFGLIVCGWSAEWDNALRAALLRTPTRRFSTYWATLGKPGENAQKVIQQRDAQTIAIKDADTFLNDIRESVRSIDELSKSDPRSAEIAVTSMKRYLQDPNHRIDLSDLVARTIERVVQEASNQPIHGQGVTTPNAETMTARLRSYESASTILQSIAVIGGSWAEDDHFSMWERAIERLGDMPLANGNIIWHGLRAYPGKLLLYSLGLGAVHSGRLKFLNHIFRSKVRSNNEHIPAVRFLVDFCSVKQRDWGSLMEGMDRHFVPFSDWLHDALRHPARHLNISDDRYSFIFDKFELLVALGFMRQDEFGDWAPEGAFIHRVQNRRRILAEMRESISSLQNRSPFVECGVFGETSDDCLQLLQAFETFILQVAHRWGIFG